MPALPRPRPARRRPDADPAAKPSLQLSLFEPPPDDPPPAAVDRRSDPPLRLAAGSVSADDLAGVLAPLLGGRLRALVLTDNRSRILSSRETADGGLAVRLHRCFAAAPVDVVEEVARLLVARSRRGRLEALAVVREHFESHGGRREAAARRRPPTRPRGAVHDLAAIRDELADRYFEGRLQVEVTWGRAPVRRRRGRRATILLGSYDAAANLVRIHPRLDRADVPRFVVAAVLHHEMLHAALPAVVRGGRRVLHSPELRRRERDFADHAAAESWLASHLPRLLRC